MRAGFYPGLEALRGLAAVLVLIQHTIYYACVFAGKDYMPLLKFDFGGFGVNLFFAISGFVIALNRGMEPAQFAARRILRIYPPFWLAIIICLGLFSLIGPVSVPSAEMFALTPSTNLDNSLKIPYWTLVFEVFFYALAAIALCFRMSDRTLAIVLGSWIFIIHALSGYLGPIDRQPGLAIIISPFNQLFAVGALCALYLDQLRRIPSVVLLIGAAASFSVLPYITAVAAFYLLYGLIVCALLIVATEFKAIPRAAGFLGETSYGLYLMHAPIMFVLGALLQPKGISLPWMIAALGGASLIGGVAFGYIEFSMHKALAALRKKRLPPVAMPEAAALSPTIVRADSDQIR